MPTQLVLHRFKIREGRPEGIGRWRKEFVKEMSFKSGVKGRGGDRRWEQRWWLWWGDMHRMSEPGGEWTEWGWRNEEGSWFNCFRRCSRYACLYEWDYGWLTHCRLRVQRQATKAGRSQTTVSTRALASTPAFQTHWSLWTGHWISGIYHSLLRYN